MFTKIQEIKIKNYVTLIVSRQVSLESVELELQEEVQRRVKHYFDWFYAINRLILSKCENIRQPLFYRGNRYPYFLLSNYIKVGEILWEI